jgi:Zn-dependent peptidase ImmA (M78 family)/transcriptional regulator with XRE-family HTH domain
LRRGTLAIVDASIGKHIAEARDLAGLDRRTLAARARVSIEDLGALEDGRAVALTTAAVARIARALHVDLVELARGNSQPALFFRQAGVPDFFDADRPLVVDGLREAAAVAHLDELLGHTYKRGLVEPLGVAGVPFQHGYELASRIRRLLGNPAGPLGSISEVLEEEFGVPVIPGGFRAQRVLALTAKEQAPTAMLVVVMVSSSHIENRRVDLAHELAHVLFDKSATPIEYWIDLEDGAELDTSKIEQRARAFAAEFLIPRAGLVEQFGPPHERGSKRSSISAAKELVQQVGNYFRAPPELTTHHLANHLYIDDNIQDAVWKGLSPQPWRAPPRMRMLNRRLAEGLREGIMTQMRARELLGLSAYDALPSDLLGS